MRISRRLAAIAALIIVAACGGPAAADEIAASPDILPVPTITIYPGDVIGNAMLADQSFPAGTRANAAILAERSEIVGKIARRTLVPGKPITTNAIAEPELVKRGAIIRAFFNEGGLSMTTLVLPLQSGALGAIIQCRNVDSGRVIMGTVEADGSIRIGSIE
jgi:flagellar basal body P-ring formation protein FlgA